MYLMLGDKEVLYFNFNEHIVSVITPYLVPFYLRRHLSDKVDRNTLLDNVQYLQTWFSRRVLSLNRDNAKQLYALFQISQVNDVKIRSELCIRCKGISIQDSYWIKEDNSNEKFADVNIRHKHFKEIVDIALYGQYPSITTDILNPELTTQGLFRKAWVREKDELYLLKSDKSQNNINTRMEVLASKMLSCFSNKIDCVKYTGRVRKTTDDNLYVDKCKNFVDDKYSFVEAWELEEFAECCNWSYREKILGYSPITASIPVIDYLLLNTDRHTQNYGFLMDNKTGRICAIAPLFDFNQALIADVFNRKAEDTLSQMFGIKETISLKELALQYKPYCNLVLDKQKFRQLKQRNKEYANVFDAVQRRYETLFNDR